jgi:hypothetical protein
MKVYITYDRYEHDEWFNVETIETSLTRSLKKFRTEDLPSFLKYGPDDCHSFVLQRVNMTKKEYEQLLEWDKDPNQYLDRPCDYYNFMCELYDRTGCVSNQSDVIQYTDGCSDVWELPHFYGLMSHQDTTDEDVYNSIMERLFDDDNFCDMVVREYIRCRY